MQRLFFIQGQDQKIDLSLGSFFALIPIKWMVQYYYRDEWPQWLTMSFVFITFLIVIKLITLVQSDLEEYHICTFSVYFVIVFGAFLRSFSTEIPIFSLVLSFAFLMIGIFLIRFSRKNPLSLTTPRNLIYWIAISLLVGYLEFLIVKDHPITFTINRSQFTILNFLFTANYQLSNFVIPEELLFRGFLWGRMRKKGYANHIILVAQALFFLVGHINFFQTQPVTSYLSILLQGIIYGLFAWKSRSVLPGIVIHTIHNTLVYFYS